MTSTLRIIDRRELCDDGKHRMRVRMPVGITVHMFGVDGVHCARGIQQFYKQHPEFTSGQMPYTYVGLVGGLVEQALDINEVGPHALRWSTPTIGVVAIGDFNKHDPTREQWDSLTELCAELCGIYRLDPRNKVQLAGHTERPNATNWPGKRCPGERWDMDQFRSDVDLMMRNAAMQRLQRVKSPGC